MTPESVVFTVIVTIILTIAVISIRHYLKNKGG